jgi:uncharacterized protein (TIGR03435 family)
MLTEFLVALADHLWQSTLFAIGAGILALALRRHQARIRYRLWLAASLKFFIPFSLLSALGGQFTLPLPSSDLLRPRISSVVIEQVAEPFSSFPIGGAVSGASETAPAWVRILPAAISLVWSLGFSIALFRWALRWKRARTLVRRSAPLREGRELAAWRRLGETGGLPNPITIVSSTASMDPAVFGLFKSTLIWPSGLSSRLTDEELQAILLHELAHVRRRDNLAAVIQMAAESVFWFHPAVWWIGWNLVREREFACDEDVLRRGTASNVYAEAVLKVCEFCLESPLACASGVTGANLRKRIEAIMTNKAAKDLGLGKKLLMASVAAFALGAPIIAGIVSASGIQHPIPPRPADTPNWEIASLKPCPPFAGGVRGGRGAGGQRAGGPNANAPGALNMNCGPFVNTLEQLIRQAYLAYADGQVNDRSRNVYIEGPSWIHSDRFEIQGEAEGAPSPAMMRGPMLQALLEDRFRLKIHAETRDVPVYELTIARSGLKLQPLAEGSCEELDPFTLPRNRPMRITPDEFEEILQTNQKPACGLVGISSWGLEDNSRTIHGRAMGFPQLAVVLSQGMDRPVIDRTGVTGLFNLRLRFAKDQNTAGFGPPSPPPGTSTQPTASAAPSGPSIFTAIQEQLGLRLEPTRGPGEFLVIDDVRRPLEN